VKPWHILGAGAIGSLFALRLHDLGESLQLIRRTDDGNTFTLTFQHAANDKSQLQRTIVLPQQTAAAEDPITHLLVATKAFDVEQAIASIAQRLLPQATIVLVGNGMGYHERIKDTYPQCIVYAATTTAGCYCSGVRERIIVSDGHTDIGRLDNQGDTPRWFPPWQRAAWSCRWRTDMTHRLLIKLAINCVINPPTALHDVPNGALLSPPLLAEFEQAITETARRLHWAGFSDIAQLLPQRAIEVASSTRHNTSSMRADKRAGKPTEVDAILGHLLNELQGPAPAPEAPLLTHWFSQLRPAD